MRALCFALTLLPLARASAEDLARAKALNEEAQVAFAASRYADAAELFEHAFATAKQPELLWNVAASHRRQYEVDGDVTRLRRARQVYLNYAELVDGAEQKEEARKEISALEAKIAEASAPAAKEVAPRAPPVAAPETGTATGRRGLAVGVVLVAAGVALGGVALGTGLASGASYDRLVERCGAALDHCPDGFEGDREAGRGLETATWAFGAIAVAAAAVGAVVLVASARRPAERIALSPIWLPGGGALSLTGRW